MARVWKLVRHGSPEEWEDSIPQKSLTEGQLVVRLGQLAASHLPDAVVHPKSRNAPRFTTSLTVKNDRHGNMSLTMYASGSRIHYIATLEETPQVPKGPRGEQRPTDVIGAAVKVMRIATGEEAETLPPDSGKDPAAAAMGRKGGAARAAAMTPERRAEVARKAAAGRWRKPTG